MKRIYIILIVVFSLVACANSVEKQVKQNAFIEVAMLKYQFIPKVLEIDVGQTVRWVNKEKRQYHSVWFEKHGSVESEYLFPEDIWIKTFDKPGTYDYRCGPHPEMVGKVVVQ